VEVNESDPAGAASLEKIGHVVVVMLENRSFDHMLGYLSLTGRRPDIDGLRPGLANQYQGRTYPVHHLATTAVELDPDHSAGAIDQQVAGGRMSGFVASAAATLAARGAGDGDPGCVMGCYDGADVPVYDHLVEEFAVCDRWFSSVPGATLPNRLYALSGAAAGSRDDRPAHIPPLYHQPSFVRHLDAHDVTWRWYSFDPGTLRLADVHYRLGHHDRFGYFSKTGLPWKTIFDITCNPKIPSFLEDAAAGTLRRIAHPVRSHLDHQNDPVPLLPQRPAAAPGGGRKTGRAGPEPALPRPARGPGQPSGGTADTHHTTSRPAAGHPDAPGRGQGRGNRSQPGPSRGPGRRRPTAQRPAAEHPLRDAQTESRRAPAGRAIGGPCLRRRPGWRDGRLKTAGTARRGFLVSGWTVRFVPQWASVPPRLPGGVRQ
jgi:hypothetical protein